MVAWGAIALVTLVIIWTGKSDPPKPPPTSAPRKEIIGYVTAGKMPACVTQAALNEFIQASAANDRQWMAQVLLKRGCTLTAPGLKAVRIENVALGIVKVRMFTPGGQDSMVLYTLSENLSADWR